MPEDVTRDPEFQTLSPQAKTLWMERNDPDFRSLSPEAKQIWSGRQGRPSAVSAPAATPVTPSPPPVNQPRTFRGAGASGSYGEPRLRPPFRFLEPVARWVRGIEESDRESRRQTMEGAREFIREPSAEAAVKTIHGATEVALPFMAPGLARAAVAAPKAVALALGGGLVGGQAAHMGAESLGATPAQADLAEMAGGAIGAGSPFFRRGISAARGMLSGAKTPPPVTPAPAPTPRPVAPAPAPTPTPLPPPGRPIRPPLRAAAPSPGAPPPFTPPKPPRSAKPKVSPDDIDPEDFMNLRRVSATEAEKANLGRIVREQAAAGGHAPKKTIGFKEIEAAAKDIDPKYLKAPRKGKTLRPEETLQLRQRINGLNDEAFKKTKDLNLKRDGLNSQDLAKREAEIDSLEQEAKGLLDVLIPTRSQDGRNLAYHRIMAQKSFDTDYWLQRAARKAGVLDDETRSAVSRAVAKGRAATTDAERDTARREMAKIFMGLEKTGPLETITAIRRAGLLTGIKTQARNLGGNTAFQALTELSKLPGSIADIGMSLFTKRRTLTGPSLQAIGRAGRESWQRSKVEVPRIWKEGSASDLRRIDMPRGEVNSSLFGGNTKADKAINYATNKVFRAMGVADRPFRAYGRRRALEDRAHAQALTEAKQGLIPKSAVAERQSQIAAKPSAQMEADVLGDEMMAVFSDENMATRAISSLRNRLGSGSGFLFDMAVPFQRTPTNIVARMMEFGGVNPKASKAALSAVMNKSLTAEQQRVIADAVGRGSVGSAMIYLGYLLADNGQATGVYDRSTSAVERAAGRQPGAVLVDGRWRQISPFSPAGNLVTIGATIHRENNRRLTNEASRPWNVANIGLQTVLDQPFAQGTKDVLSLTEGPTSASRVASRAIGSFVPTAVADIARLSDTEEVRRSTRGQGLLGSATERLPVARESLPVMRDVLGRPMKSEPRTAIDPTIATRAQEQTDPMIAEVLRVAPTIGYPGRREDETPEEEQARNAYLGRLMELRLRKLMSRDIYSNADDEIKGEMVRRTVSDLRSRVAKSQRGGRWQGMTPQERVAFFQDKEQALMGQIEGLRPSIQ